MMWHPYKWLDDLAEKSGWWIIPYSLLVRITIDKIFRTLTDQQGYTVAILFFSIMSFFGIKLILKTVKGDFQYYKICLYLLIIIYIIAVPIYTVYFLTYHPLLGSTISAIFFFSLAICYQIIMLIKNKEQV